jgi:DNA mismatch repair protein MutL
MGIIKALDPTTIQKIAAGEVIDRPSSIVKELIENSIDASAKTITIDIDNGGLSRIQIVDDGTGIRAEDIPIAAMPHTTSKITTVEDIFGISTRGFRGEALSSIAHVGTLCITSKHRDDTIGTQLIATLSTMSSPKQIAHPTGTTMLITGLFDDIPVRRKFLKSATTEFGYIYEIVSHFSLIFPDITFVLRHNGKESLNTRGSKNLSDRIDILLGSNVQKQLIPIDYTTNDIHVSGAITQPGQTYPNRKWQLFGINGRPVKSQILYKATLDAFADVVPARRFPLAILNIHLPPDSIDVNIHPQKLDIKFQKSQHIYDAIRRAISGGFQREEAQLADAEAGLSPFLSQHAATLQNANKEKPQSTSFFSESPIWITSPRYTTPMHTPAPSTLERAPINPALPYLQNSTSITPLAKQLPLSQETTFRQALPENTPSFLQILNTYIVIPTPTGMWIMDQHAVHERILYERLKENSDKKLSQPLLIPHPIHIPGKAMMDFQEIAPLLAEIGFETEDFGHDQVLIRSIPQWAQNLSLTPFFEAILENSAEASSDTIIQQQQKEQLQMKACKAAIKAGKILHEAEVKSLIANFLQSPSNYTCPHGRPLAKFFDKAAFERWFLR